MDHNTWAYLKTCLLKHEMALSTDGTESVCGEYALWWICLSTPFIYTLFYIFYIFSYITHTDYSVDRGGSDEPGLKWRSAIKTLTRRPRQISRVPCERTGLLL